MRAYTYEIHDMNNPLLPFRFRPLMEVTKRQGLPNWHEETEILYCFDGAGAVGLAGESIPFRAGDTIIINTRTPHFVQSSETVRYCCLIVKSSFLTENGIDPSALHFHHRIHNPEMQERMESVRSAFVSLREEHFDGILQFRSTVLSLFALLCREYASPLEKSEKSDESVNLALTWLYRHYREKISLDDLAAHVGISKFHLSREFKRSTGRSVMSTVVLLRLNDAKDRIESGEQISQAARSCGFSNLSYFTRSFQKQFHLLPSEVKKK